jgi:glycosyltransferase involved in cell wall biosynthesis
MKLKILMVNTQHYYGGGNSTDCLNTAALLREKGHEVAFFAMASDKNLPDPNADLFVHGIDFQELNRNKTLANSLKVLARVIYSRETEQKFARMCERFGPDLIHLHNIHDHLSPSLIMAAKKRRVPVIWRLHDYKSICPNSYYLSDRTGKVCEACGRGYYLAAMLQRCKKDSFLATSMAVLEAYVHEFLGFHRHIACYLAPSHFLQSKYLQQDYPDKKLRYLPYFIPDDMFQENDDKGSYFLFLGKVDPVKGIFPLLDAARRLPQVRFRIAGAVREPLSIEFPKLLSHNVEFLGLKNRQEVRGLLAGARALVFPSIWYENQPLAILEAFAAGKAVIASDLGGMTELVSHGETGLLVPPGNAATLAGALERLWAEPDQAREMGRQAQQYARAKHSALGHYQELEAIYEGILGETKCS